MIWLIELLIFVMTGLLLFHAIRSRAPQFAFIFWGAGMVMGLFREIAMSKISELYTYGDFHLTISGIPFIFILLWVNLSYISWEWSNNFLGSEYFHEKSMGQHLPLIFLTMILSSFFFEALTSQFHLIQWKVDAVMPMMWGSVPLLAPFAYGFTGVVFMKSAKMLWDKPHQSWPQVAIKLFAIQPLVILIFMGLLFITNLVIVLIFS